MSLGHQTVNQLPRCGQREEAEEMKIDTKIRHVTSLANCCNVLIMLTCRVSLLLKTMQDNRSLPRAWRLTLRGISRSHP